MSATLQDALIASPVRIERIGDATLYLGDCRAVLPEIEADACITDPPYGVTSLEWDKPINGWSEMLPCRSLWCFGSMRFFMAARFPGWTYAQEVIWEKHNGSNSMADRFRRLHEIAVHFYRGPWADLYKSPVTTADATARSVRRKRRPPHWNDIGAHQYESQDGGPRLMGSVIYARSCHGYAVHPTQKPVEILRPLIEYSCPPGGTVLDPFGGSFSTAVAALSLGRKFLGIEVDPERFEVGCENLRQSLRQQGLFS